MVLAWVMVLSRKCVVRSMGPGYRRGVFQGGLAKTSSRSALARLFPARMIVPMSSYGQFCPIAQAAQILAERWTPLVLRELICGSTRFNDLRRGVPLMSSSLLSQRLSSWSRQAWSSAGPARPGAASNTT